MRLSVATLDRTRDTDEIRWFANTYREVCLRSDRRIAQVAVSMAILAVVGLCAVLVTVVKPGLPPTLETGGEIVLILSLLVGGYALLLLYSPRSDLGRSWYSPIRVGFSTQGIHVTFDSASDTRRRREYSSMPFIPWETIEGVARPISQYMRHQVTFNSERQPPPEIHLLSVDLVDRISTEVQKHANDLGPE